MLDNRKEATDALARAMSDALTNGLTADDIDEIAQMVAAEQPRNLDYSAQHAAERAKGADDLPIYTELPEGLIDLPSAMRKYGCRRGRLDSWVQRGRLKVYGRLKGAARGGGYVVVSEAELTDRLATVPRKGGRPRKTAQSSID